MLKIATHKILFFAKEPIFSVAHISRNLEHPRFVGIGSATGELHPSCRQLHDKEQVEGSRVIAARGAVRISYNSG